MLRGGSLRLVVQGSPRERVRVSARTQGGRHGSRLVRSRRFRLGRSGRLVVRVRLTAAGRKPLRAAVAGCRVAKVAATVTGPRHSLARAKRRLSGGKGCRRPGGIVVPGQGPRAGTGSSPIFSVGAATADFTPPAHGALPNDASDCDPSGTFDGPRAFAFMEPYKDTGGAPVPDPTNPSVPSPPHPQGHYTQGDPYLDCNHNGRWDGNFLGGGADSPRFFTKVADPVTSRALVVGNGSAADRVEVTDQEGLFNVYQDEIRKRANAELAQRGCRRSTASSSRRRTTSRRPTRSASRGSTRRPRA